MLLDMWPDGSHFCFFFFPFCFSNRCNRPHVERITVYCKYEITTVSKPGTFCKNHEAINGSRKPTRCPPVACQMPRTPQSTKRVKRTKNRQSWHKIMYVIGNSLILLFEYLIITYKLHLFRATRLYKCPEESG